jgi:mono/diheme cytochrome c family protein
VWIMKKLLLLISGGMLILAGCSTERDPSYADPNATLAPVPAEYAGLTNPLGPEAADQGAQIFNLNCAACHGPQGHGDGPAGESLDPRPRNLAEIQTKAEDDFLFWRIREGKPGTSMVGWKGILSDEQIWQTVSFIRILK